MTSHEDRNFDPITDHFAKKVYGGLKGDIRLAVLKQDLYPIISEMAATLNRPLRILDVGAGLAQIAIELATKGHSLTINDISQNMLTEAQIGAKAKGVLQDINWLVCPYQHLNEKLQNQENDGYDLILCHALLEWLAEPQQIMPFFERWLVPNGIVSLCFYNPVSFVYRNLIMGNFNLLNNPDYQADNKKSLTPNNPVSFNDVEGWLKKEGFMIDKVSGLRVFHDYAPLKRGGHNHPEAVIEMELRYSSQEPYKWLGRYLHILASRPTLTTEERYQLSTKISNRDLENSPRYVAKSLHLSHHLGIAPHAPSKVETLSKIL